MLPDGEGLDLTRKLRARLKVLLRRARLDGVYRQTGTGQAVPQLETGWRDGTRQLVTSPLEFMLRHIERQLRGSQIREYYVGCGSAP